MRVLHAQPDASVIATRFCVVRKKLKIHSLTIMIVKVRSIFKMHHLVDQNRSNRTLVLTIGALLDKLAILSLDFVVSLGEYLHHNIA